MILVGLIEEILQILFALLGHFVTYTAVPPTLSADYEWNLPAQTSELTEKGNFLMGAVADIAVYGAILVDWIVQMLVGTGVQVNEAP